jgi:nitrate reductase gamma subunit
VTGGYFRERDGKGEILKRSRVRFLLVVPIKHDYGLAAVYGAAFFGWGFLVAHAITALIEVEGNFAVSLPVGGAVGLLALIGVVVHDRRERDLAEPADCEEPT